MYKLVASYQTGDSFGNEDIDNEEINIFESEEAGLAAMKRLEEHYKWYQWNDKSDYDKQRALGRGEKQIDEPEWHKALEYDFQASYYLDDGTLFKDTMPYCGYFETLYGLKLKRSSYKIDFN